VEVVFETKDLTVGYDGKPLIRDICAQIHRGEIVALIGPNGAGKSTILKSVTKHLRTISGKVLVEGEEIGAVSYRALARKVAVMLTERLSPELMTCRDVVSSGRYPYTGRMGLLTQEDDEIVLDAMRMVGVLELAERGFGAVSDGQRQRVLLARAICQKPEILVLDEPTSYLDIRHKLELLGVLRRMAREKGITVILSMHEIDLAQKAADKILCVKGDRIAAFGEPAEIFRDERIRELYELPAGAYDTLFGSVELPGIAGEPQVFVLSSCGSGIPVFRKLQKDGVPFAAGILYENDVDFRVARSLAAEVVSEKPFEPISDAALARAKALIEKCPRVIVTEFPIGPCNERVRELLKMIPEGKKI
jgi:iron complex transport system ATP-binding protein